MHWWRESLDGTVKSRSSQGMDPPEECPRSLQIPRLHGLLSLLYPGVLTDCLTFVRSHEAGDDMALGQQRAASIQGAARQDGQQTCLTTTQLRQNILPANGCIKVWHRGSAILRWRDERSHAKKTTPNHILFSHVLPHRTKLQCP